MTQHRSSSSDYNGNLFDDKSTSLFNDTLLKDFLSNSNLASPAAPAIPCDTGHGTSLWFFFFPVVGFVFLFGGFYILKKRQQLQDAEAVRNYNARVEASNAEREVKLRLRLKMVEKSLVTTKLTRKQTRLGFRGRTLSMETDETSILSLSSHSVPGSSEFFPCPDESFCSNEEGLPPTPEERVVECTHGKKCPQHGSSCSYAASQVLNSSSCHVLELEDYHGATNFDLETCAICLEPYRENESVSYSKHQNCAHAFHTDCILSWLQDEHRNDCPCCRGPYLHLVVYEQDGEYFGSISTSRYDGNNSDQPNEVVDNTEEEETENFCGVNAAIISGANANVSNESLNNLSV
mmetsp:Transcript_19353/g.40660  ORF Transcript_19353/g.40660 Transcript_19353/m.40660 type:complete len:349 (+) Transcript_19353:132-1178(+)